jgi:membrane-associated phospholipid phosphatase
MATATSFLRIMSDRHWTSDVLAGVAVGVGVGYVVPAAHYNRIFKPKLLGGNTLVMPNLSSNEAGLNVAGSF